MSGSGHSLARESLSFFGWGDAHLAQAHDEVGTTLPLDELDVP